MKLVEEPCNNSKILYSRAMQKEIQHKLQRLGLVKAHPAVFIIKDLLGDDSANNLENLNVREPKFEKFWEVRYFSFYFILFYFSFIIIIICLGK